MRIAGRITLFGEAYGGLRERASASVPTAQAVFTEEHAAHWDGSNTYIQSADQIGPALRNIGAIQRLRTPLLSTLPIEYGLASSTALALAHLGRRSGPGVAEAVAHVDGATLGFRPSGADYAAVSRGESGVFGLSGWTYAEVKLPRGSHLVLPVKDRLRNKQAPTFAMRSASEQLGPLIDRLVADFVDSLELNLDVLWEYSNHLMRIGVYSSHQLSIVEPLLKRGIVAKGVGAMYDRAILVLADPGIWEGRPPGKVLLQDE